MEFPFYAVWEEEEKNEQSAGETEKPRKKKAKKALQWTLETQPPFDYVEPTQEIDPLAAEEAFAVEADTQPADETVVPLHEEKKKEEGMLDRPHGLRNNLVAAGAGGDELKCRGPSLITDPSTSWKERKWSFQWYNGVLLDPEEVTELSDLDKVIAPMGTFVEKGAEHPSPDFIALYHDNYLLDCLKHNDEVQLPVINHYHLTIPALIRFMEKKKLTLSNSISGTSDLGMYFAWRDVPFRFIIQFGTWFEPSKKEIYPAFSLSCLERLRQLNLFKKN
jgi:hypothetical protein